MVALKSFRKENIFKSILMCISPYQHLTKINCYKMVRCKTPSEKAKSSDLICVSQKLPWTLFLPGLCCRSLSTVASLTTWACWSLSCPQSCLALPSAWASKPFCSSDSAATSWMPDLTHYLSSSGTVGGSCHCHQATHGQTVKDSASLERTN